MSTHTPKQPSQPKAAQGTTRQTATPAEIRRSQRRADTGGPTLILPRFYSTSSTTRLETRARQLGLRLGISYGEGDRCDRYFITSVNGKKLERLVPLGWTSEEAEEALVRVAKEGL